MTTDNDPSFRQRRNRIVAIASALLIAASFLWHFDINVPGLVVGVVGAFTFFAADDLAND